MNNSYLMVVENCQQTPKNDPANGKNEFYDFKRGLCVILNQEKFSETKNIKQKYNLRKGTEKDVNRLKSTFEDFGFKVEVSHNLDQPNFLRELKTIGGYSKEQYDCILVTILSHGKERTVVTSDCKDVKLEKVREEMCTPTLKGVVKMVVVQACQGDFLGREETDGPSGFTTKLSADLALDDLLNDSNNIRFSDFVMFVATIGKFQSVRNTKEGAWFIQTICDVLNEFDEIEWSDFTRKVKKLVFEKRGTVCGIENVVQVPEILHDTLKMKFQFRKKKNGDSIIRIFNTLSSREL
ncbi:caspase-3-like [Belonocnema kinseyi]|uniref:caspase-3-like n=1 Tax=Belonocnema kinseyi TaxID=2817044 RepID=UPI00143DEDE0|nr:caspase-3-like [Belonocnema kinseyi]